MNTGPIAQLLVAVLVIAIVYLVLAALTTPLIALIGALVAIVVMLGGGLGRRSRL